MHFHTLILSSFLVYHYLFIILFFPADWSFLTEKYHKVQLKSAQAPRHDLIGRDVCRHGHGGVLPCDWWTAEWRDTWPSQSCVRIVSSARLCWISLEGPHTHTHTHTHTQSETCREEGTVIYTVTHTHRDGHNKHTNAHIHRHTPVRHSRQQKVLRAEYKQTFPRHTSH